MIKPVACGLLKGMLDHIHGGIVNYISAPSLAATHGIEIAQSQTHFHDEYSTLVSAKCYFKNKNSRVISGTLFHRQPRIVQISNYQLDIDPNGIILIMLNHDRPGVIGKVGTILAENQVNIAEWRLGRTNAGEQAMAFINLDSQPEQAVIDQITAIKDVIKAKVIAL